MSFTDIDAARAALSNPTLSPEELMSIAQGYPDLWVEVARHPNAYPDLLTWLGQVGGDDVQQSISNRDISNGLPPIPPPPPTAKTPSPAPEVLSLPPESVQSVSVHTTPSASKQAPSVSDSGSFGWAILGFLVPIIGLVLWLVWMHTRPRSAKMSRNGFIIGLAIEIVSTAAIVVVALQFGKAGDSNSNMSKKQFTTFMENTWPSETGGRLWSQSGVLTQGCSSLAQASQKIILSAEGDDGYDFYLFKDASSANQWISLRRECDLSNWEASPDGSSQGTIAEASVFKQTFAGSYVDIYVIYHNVVFQIWSGCDQRLCAPGIEPVSSLVQRFVTAVDAAMQ